MGLNEKFFQTAANTEFSAVYNGTTGVMISNLYNIFKGTISLWYKASTPSEEKYLFSSALGSSSRRGVNVYFQPSGQITYAVSQGTSGTLASNVITSGSNNFFDGNFHNLMITWDLSSSGTNAYLYVDNSQKLSAAATTGNWVANENSSFVLGLGCYALGQSGGGGTFQGNLDETVIYNRVLSSSERSTLYNRSGIPTGEQAHYKFDNNFNDETGNNNATAQYITFGPGI